MAFIYKLSFPNDERVYIGQTTRSIEARLQEHCKKLISNTHYNSKLQDTYNTIGILPNISIELECSASELDTKEIDVISKYNSFKNGFNATIGGKSGGYGENSPNALYTLDDYTCVLSFLAYTNLTAIEISAETGVSVDVVRDISSSTSHVYLKEIDPIAYDLMIAKNRYVSKEGWPNIVCPEGKVYIIDNALKFAQEHGLNASNLYKVLRGESEHHKGWVLEIPKYTGSKREVISYTLVSPDGEVHTFTNQKSFADTNGLSQSEVSNLITGTRKYAKGWHSTNTPRQNVYKLMSPLNETHTFTNQREFARQQGLSQSMLCQLVLGKISSHKGWKNYVNN